MSSKRSSRNSTAKAISVVALMILGAVAWYAYSSTKPSHHQVEAPATTSETKSLEYVSIPESVRSEILVYPGFTVSFNADYKQPNYVVWELTRDEVRHNAVGRRNNNFAPDLSVQGCPTLNDYRNSGYDRGHMAPAADMKWSREASNSCFLLTNMSPQHHGLNSGSWNSLEERCRDWAIRDSALVIVCGPILTDKLTRYIGASKVAVPERYFKVILSPYTTPPQGIGFIMANGPMPGGMQAAAVSIDEVEAITGFDFFNALPDDIEDDVEAQCNFPKWTRR